MSFLDEHCLVFDTEEENKLEYTQIHNVRPLTLTDSVELPENGRRPA
jgi:hypothetical protein